MKISRNNKTALVFGASGLVGGHLLKALAQNENYQKVYSFGRRKLGINDGKTEEVIIDFNQMSEFGHLIKGDDIFICLGTTIKTAGSQEAFRKVDFDYVYQAAQIAVQNGTNQLLLVSSVGADANSSVFYSKVKGEIEDAVKEMPFWSVKIFQPSLLLGNRNETRLAEGIGQSIGRFLNRFTTDLFDLYQPVEGENVAKAMVIAAQELEGGEKTYQSHVIKKMGEEQENLLSEA
jgi:uncharacterized protein YbjT (DUF2867 family)